MSLLGLLLRLTLSKLQILTTFRVKTVYYSIQGKWDNFLELWSHNNICIFLSLSDILPGHEVWWWLWVIFHPTQSNQRTYLSDYAQDRFKMLGVKIKIQLPLNVYIVVSFLENEIYFASIWFMSKLMWVFWPLDLFLNIFENNHIV